MYRHLKMNIMYLLAITLFFPLFTIAENTITYCPDLANNIHPNQWVLNSKITVNGVKWKVTANGLGDKAGTPSFYYANYQPYSTECYYRYSTDSVIIVTTKTHLNIPQNMKGTKTDKDYWDCAQAAYECPCNNNLKPIDIKNCPMEKTSDDTILE